MSKTHPGDLLDRLIKENAISEGELSRATRVPQPTIHRIRNKESKDPRRRTLVPLARYFGISVEDFYSRGAQDELRPVRESPPVYEHRLVPLITWAAAGTANAAGTAARSRRRSRVPALGNVGPRTFALRVRGDAMSNPYGAPTFPPGCVIIVDPDRAAEDGSYVIARLHGDKEPTFKQLIVDGARRLLRPVNPRYPLVPVQGDVEICGVVVAKAYESLSDTT